MSKNSTSDLLNIKEMLDAKLEELVRLHNEDRARNTVYGNLMQASFHEGYLKAVADIRSVVEKSFGRLKND